MKISTEQPKIKQKQHEILLLLYRFRFLNRKQIQTLLNHKHHHLVQEWLNELTNQKYILQYYDNKLAPVPAVYCLDKEGRKYLKNGKDINTKALSRIWREKKYSLIFREHCLFLSDIYLSLQGFAVESKSVIHFHTKTDLYGMDHFISPVPDAYFAIEYSKDDIKRYFLDILDDIPPVALRKRIKEYLTYYDSDEWQDNADKPFPEIILICPNNRIKSHLYYYLRKKLGEEGPSFYLAVRDVVASKGLNSEALQKVAGEE